MEKEYEKKFLSYADYGSMMRWLGDKIKDLRYFNKIKYIYGIPRGGLPLATHLSHTLEIDLIHADRLFTVKDLVLVVDDIVDTGITIARLPRIWPTASLYYKPRSSIKPDIYLEEVPNDIWIVFPWELMNETPNR